MYTFFHFSSRAPFHARLNKNPSQKKKSNSLKREKKGETHSSLNFRATKNKKEKAAFAERAHPREKLSFRLSSFFGGRRKKSEFCFTFSSPHFNNKNPSGE